MGDSLRVQIDTYLTHLDHLIQRGRQLHDVLATDPSNAQALSATRIWQQDCGVTVNQLSGGSKAHWLARLYSEAFLMRSRSGGAVEAVPPSEIIRRLVSVLAQAANSLTQMSDGPVISASPEAPPRRPFGFVHNPELRPVVEQAYSDNRRAFEQNNYGQALFTCCVVLEAIVTDALEHKGLSALTVAERPAGKIADWSFEERLAVAEGAGLIHSECARLPPAARRYRDLANARGEHSPEVIISERDARRAGQVLHVVMRDLDPGR